MATQQEMNEFQAAQQAKMMKMLENGKTISCTCGQTIFKEGIQMIKVSAMDPNNDTGKEQVAHIPALYCISCQKGIKL